MVDCWCGAKMGPDAVKGHTACETEFNRRDKAGVCVACGKKKATEHDTWCKECDAVERPTYTGYPGGP